MRVTVFLSVILAALMLYWFWPQHKPVYTVVLVGDHSGMLADRDLAMMSLLQKRLQRKAMEAGVTVHTFTLNSQQPAAALMKQADEVLAGENFLLMGCADSACVRALLPALEKHRALLLYPGRSEGLLSSPYVVQLGPVANQFLFPSVSWVRQNLGHRLMFVGSESARSHMLLRLLEDQLLVDEKSRLISAEFVAQTEQLPVVTDMVMFHRPDVLLVDVCEWRGGEPLIRPVAEAGIRVFSLCTDHKPLSGISYYYVTAYFDHKHNPANGRLKQSVGDELSPLENNLHWMADLWLTAQQRGELINVDRWRAFLRSYNDLTASGPVLIDQHLQGSWRDMFIVEQRASERAVADQRLLWMSESPLRPVMYPGLDAPSDWQHYLTIYWRNAGGEWRSPITPENQTTENAASGGKG